IDPHVIDKQCDRYVKGSGQRKLKPTCERYGVQLDDWHTAEADALAALLITEAQFERFPQLNDMGPQQLFAAQKAWRAEQQAGLQEWFRTKASPEQGGDPHKVIDGSWPLIPAQRAGGEGWRGSSPAAGTSRRGPPRARRSPGFGAVSWTRRNGTTKWRAHTTSWPKSWPRPASSMTASPPT